MPHLEQGLVIAATGIGGVFSVLLVLMVLVMGIGMVFGKKPAAKKTEGGKAAADDKQKTSARPEKAAAQKDG
jgi:Na+-transporting methylmalonyl-CoA/oxaloacetate decarboxylase gamma subunit